MRLDVIISKQTAKVSVYENDKLTLVDNVRRTSDRSRDAFAKKLGIDPALLLQLATCDEGSLTIEVPEAPPQVFQVEVRSFQESFGTILEGSSFEDVFRQSLEHPGDLVKWDDPTIACVVDVDYHQSGARSIDFLHALVDRVRPTPACWWVSRNGGLKMLFLASSGYQANELAAVAAVSLSNECDAVEIMPHTRIPDSVYWQAQNPSFLPLESIANEGAVQSFVSSRGWTIGQNRPHSDCPIDPERTSTHSAPVHIGEFGIFCHSCNSRGNGFVPYSRLCGTDVSLVRVCANSFCHWAHAKYVLASKIPVVESIAKLYYQALMKQIHGSEDPRIPIAMRTSEDMVRGRDCWINPTSLEPFIRINAKLRDLPYTLFIDDENELRASCSRVEELQQSHDLTCYGYPPLTLVRGVDLYHYHRTSNNPNRVGSTIALKWYQHDERYAPKIIPLPECTPDKVEESWLLVESLLPGISRSYVQLLIAAKALAESQAHSPIFIFASGPSASGKSTTPAVVASMCGDACLSVRYNDDHSRLFQSLKSASDTATFVVVDEILKSVKRNDDIRTALNFVLTLNPETKDYVVHRGSMAFGARPVLVLTDTDLASAIQQDTQLGRRILHVQLSGEVPWRDSLTRLKLNDVAHMRTSSLEIAQAFNYIISSVVHRWFSDSTDRTIEQIARELGILTIRDTAETVDTSAEYSLLNLFNAVCDAMPPDQSYQKRWPKPGIKAFNHLHENELAKAWLDCCEKPEEWKAPRLVVDKTWQRVLQFHEPIKLEIHTHRDMIAVRFISKSGLINEQIREQLNARSNGH